MLKNNLFFYISPLYARRAWEGYNLKLISLINFLHNSDCNDATTKEI